MIKGQRSYPSEIYIADHVWPVKFRRELFDNCLGLCTYDGQQGLIELKQGQNPKELANIFMHECLHALEFSFGFEMSHETIYDLQSPLTMLFEQNYEAFGKIFDK